jgi:FkbM family methyltransferase
MISSLKLWMLRHLLMPEWIMSRLQHGVLQEGGRITRYQNDDGILFDLDMDEYIQKRIYLYQYYEPECARVARRFMRTGGVVVDVGANIGQYSLLAAKLVGESGRVIAFEPNSKVLERLLHLVDINDFGNIEVIPCAVSDTVGESLFYPPPLSGNTGTGSLIPQEIGPSTNDMADRPEPICVRTVRLDQVMESRGISEISFMKVDVEGFEMEVLRSLTSCLKRQCVHALMVEVWPDQYRNDGSSSNDVFAYMRGFGYHAFVADWRGRLHSIKGVLAEETNVFFISVNA